MENKWQLTRTSGKEILERLAEAVILALIFLVPLWFAYLFPTYNVIELNKAVLFRSLVWLLLFLTGFRFIIYPPRVPLAAASFFRRYWLVPTIFIAGLGLLLFFSDDPVRSFYGTIERQQGLISYLFYFLWFVLASINLVVDKGGKKLRRAVMAAALSGTLVAIYGILQVLGIDFLTWPFEPYLTLRTLSTFGQPNFLASWLLLVMPLSLYLWKEAARTARRTFWLLAFILQLVCLFLTGSRGGLLGLILVVLISASIWFVRSGWSRSRKLLLTGTLIVIVVVSVIVLDVVSGGRIREMKTLDSGSLGVRANIYRAALSAWQEQPWFGYGLENGENVFIRHYSPDWGIYGNVGQTADRAHNIFLDHLLTGGLAGLALYLIFIGFFFSLARKLWRHGDEKALSLAISAGAAAYLFSLLASFTILSGEIYLWFFLALLVAACLRQDSSIGADIRTLFPERPRTRLASLTAYLAGGVAALILLAFSVYGISRESRILIADHYFQKIYTTLPLQEYFTALVLDGYLSEQRVNPIYRETYDIFWVAALSETYPAIKELAPRYALKEKLARINGSLSLRSHNHILAKARVSRLLGDFSAASAYLDMLVSLSPNWPTAYHERGNLAAAQQDWEEAAINYERVISLLPATDDTRLNDEHRADVSSHHYRAFKSLGDVRLAQGDYIGAEADYQTAFMNQPTDYTLLKKIGDTFYLRGDLASAILYNEHGFRRSPEDYSWPLALAALHHETGEDALAREYLDQALLLAPENEELIRLDAEYSR